MEVAFKYLGSRVAERSVDTIRPSLAARNTRKLNRADQNKAWYRVGPPVRCPIRTSRNDASVSSEITERAERFPVLKPDMLVGLHKGASGSMNPRYWTRSKPLSAKTPVQHLFRQQPSKLVSTTLLEATNKQTKCRGKKSPSTVSSSAGLVVGSGPLQGLIRTPGRPKPRDKQAF